MSPLLDQQRQGCHAPPPCLVFVEAHFNCYLRSTYTDTKSNHLADDILWDNLPSCQRYHQPPPTQLQSLWLYWTCCWIIKLTGPLSPGTIDSALLSTRPSTINPENVPGGYETVPWFLCEVQCAQSLSGSEHLPCCFTAFLAD